MKNRSQFSWTQKDYIDANQPLPDSLLDDYLHTEGELMNRDEIDCWIADSAASFCLIREKDEKRFETLYKEFESDIDYLGSIGKITPDEAMSIKNKDLYKFDC